VGSYIAMSTKIKISKMAYRYCKHDYDDGQDEVS